MNFANRMRISLFVVIFLWSCNSNTTLTAKENEHNQPADTKPLFTKLIEGSNPSNIQLKKLVDMLKSKNKLSFLGFDGKWDNCNHDNHNYKEFFTFANKRISLELSLQDTSISYTLDYLERDIREIWGTETVVKKIKSEGTLEVKLLNSYDDFKFRLNDPNLDELIYINLDTTPQALDLQIDFDCKTCSGETLYYLYPKTEFINVLVGNRLYLWKDYY